ncbi:MAG: hypothetical protein PHD25_06915 [Bacteroidales bacterium]|nr:hypothetical protein [Bacteroidales bacterium]
MSINKIKNIINNNKFFLTLFLFFCLNNNIYSIDNNDVILHDRLRDMEYFTRLLEFATGLLVILCLALSILLIISARKNKLKIRQIRGYEQHQATVLQKEDHTRATGFNASETGRIASGSSSETTARNVKSLEKEIEDLRIKLQQEHALREKMENEVAELLSRMRGA